MGRLDHGIFSKLWCSFDSESFFRSCSPVSRPHLLFLGNERCEDLLIQNGANVAGYAGEEVLIWGVEKGKKLLADVNLSSYFLLSIHENRDVIYVYFFIQ